MRAAEELVVQVRRWYGHRRPEARDVQVTALAAPAGGHSNELLFVTVELDLDTGVERADVVVRLVPSGPPLFPEYDLAMQVAVQAEMEAAGVPVASPIIQERDPSWLGRPFIVLPVVDGRHPGEVPATTAWVMALAPDEQRRLHTAFLDVVATIHRVPHAGGPLPGLLRCTGLAGEVAWWDRFSTWACHNPRTRDATATFSSSSRREFGESVGVAPVDGVAPNALHELFGWCMANVPATEPPASVLWGDVRLGNAVIGSDLRPAAILDWELATIGPAESDVAWFAALSGMTDHFFGTRVPGFLDRDEVMAHHERGIGRPLQDMGWHEAFAVSRAAAASVRTAIVAAITAGTPLPDPAAHPVVRYAQRVVSDLA